VFVVSVVVLGGNLCSFVVGIHSSLVIGDVGKWRNAVDVCLLKEANLGVNISSFGFIPPPSFYSVSGQLILQPSPAYWY
jgi:hypothetical protein